MTGIDTLSEAADTKRVAMLKDIMPQLSRLTMFLNATDLNMPTHFENTQAALKKLGMTGQVIEARKAEVDATIAAGAA